MSFLDLQDLAAVAAEIDLERWCGSWEDGRVLLGVFELGVFAVVAGLLLHRGRNSG